MAGTFALAPSRLDLRGLRLPRQSDLRALLVALLTAALIASVLTVADDRFAIDASTSSQEGSVSRAVDEAAISSSQTVLPGQVPEGLTASEWADIQSQIAARQGSAGTAVTAQPAPLVQAPATVAPLTVVPVPAEAPAAGFSLALPTAAVMSSAGVEASFSPTSASITTASSAEAVMLSTSTIGSSPAGSAVVRETAAGVELVRAGVTEYFHTVAEGIEHGYVIDAPVHAGDDLVITVDVADGNPAMAGTDVLITRTDGSTVGYRDLYVFDATGAELPSFMAVEGSTITLNVDSAGAVYPITVDPVITEDELATGRQNASGERLGEAIAVSADTLVVSASGDDDTGPEFGKIDIYDYFPVSDSRVFDSAWYGGINSDSDYGWSIAMNTDTIVVGAPGDSLGGADAGAVYVYVKSGGSWAQDAILYGCVNPSCDPETVAGIPSSRFGYAVDITDNGNSVWVGIPGQDTVVEYERDGGGGWVRGAVASGDSSLGASLDVAGDGSLIVVGTPTFPASGQDDAGQARLYSISGNLMTLESLISPVGATAEANFGAAVAIEEAGTTPYIVITEPHLTRLPGDTSGGFAGTAYVYDISTPNSLPAPTAFGLAGVDEAYGYSVAADGNIIIVGVPFTGTNGDVDIIQRSGSSFASITFPPFPMTGTTAEYGTSVAVSPAGQVAAGAPGFDGLNDGINGGGAIAYDDVTTPNSVFVQSLVSSHGDQLGAAVSIDGNRMAVAAIGDDEPNPSAGSVQIFERASSTDPWVFQAIITDPTPEDDGGFGDSIDLLGDNLVVGESDRFGDGSETGTVHVFEFSGGTWNQRGSTVSGIGGAGDWFGASVAFIDADNFLAGSPGEASEAGTAYHVNWTGADWGAPTALPDVSGPGQRFGFSVDLYDTSSGYVAVIGAPGLGATGGVAIYSGVGSAAPSFEQTLFDVAGWSAGQRIGSAVAAEHGRIVAAGMGDQLSTNVVEAYVIEETSPGNWATVDSMSTAALGADVSEVANNFVDIYGGTIAIARPGNGGEVGIFRYDGTDWPSAPNDVLIPTATAAGDRVGFSVEIDERTLAAGVPGDDATGTNAGAVATVEIPLIATFTNVGGTDGWDTGAEWDVGIVPGAGDVAIIADPVTLESPTSIAELIVLSGQSVDVDPGDTLQVTGGSTAALPSSSNAGTITVESILTLETDLANSGTLTVDPGATLDFPSAGDVDVNPGGTINLDGTLDKTGTGTTTFANSILWNEAATAVIDVQAGTLNFDGITEHDGTINIAAGASIGHADNGDLGAGATYNFEITGPASNPANYGQVTWGGLTSISGTVNSTLNGYTPFTGETYDVVTCAFNDCNTGLAGSSTPDFTVNLTAAAVQLVGAPGPCDTEWTGAGPDDNWETVSNWTSGVPGASDVVCMDVGTVDNVTINGTHTIDSFDTAQENLFIVGSLTVTNPSTIDGRVDLASSGTLRGDGLITLTAPVQTLNGGTVQGSVTVASGAQWNSDANGATIDGSVGGTFTVDGTFAIQGDLSVQDGADIVINGNLNLGGINPQTVLTAGATSTITNNGEIFKAGANTATIPAGVTLDLTDGARLYTNVGTLEVLADGTWTGTGTPIELRADAGTTLSVGGNQTMSGQIDGIFAGSFGDVIFRDTKTIPAGGLTLDFPTDMLSVTVATINGPGVLTIPDAIAISGGTVLNADVTNNGTLTFEGAAVINGTINTTLATVVLGGTVSYGLTGTGGIDYVFGGITVNHVSIAGITLGPDLTLSGDSSSSFDIGPGTVFLQSDFVNVGALNLSSGTLLRTNGNVVLAPGSTLNVDISGASSGGATNYGQLVVQAPGTLDLGGTLTRTGAYAPTPIDSYGIIIGCDCPAETFDTVSVAPLTVDIGLNNVILDGPVCDTEWTGATNSLWSEAGNWTSGVPISTDVVCMDVGGGTTVTIDGAQEIDRFDTAQEDLVITGSLVVNGTSFIDGEVTINGTLDGDGDVILSGGGTLDGGTIRGLISVPNLVNFTIVDGTIDGEGAADPLVANFINDGIVTVTGTPLSIDNGASVGNNGTWIFDSAAAQDIQIANPGTSTFTNGAVFRKQGAGTLNMPTGVTFDMGDGSAFEVLGGTVDFAMGGTWTAPTLGVDINVTAGSVFDFGGDQTFEGRFNGLPTGSTPGTVLLAGTKSAVFPAGAILDFPEDAAAVGDETAYMLDVAGATLAGPGDWTSQRAMYVSGDLTVASLLFVDVGGDLAHGSGTVTVTGDLYVSGVYRNVDAAGALTGAGFWQTNAGGVLRAEDGTGATFVIDVASWTGATGSSFVAAVNSPVTFDIDSQLDTSDYVVGAGAVVTFLQLPSFGPTDVTIGITGDPSSTANYGRFDFTAAGAASGPEGATLDVVYGAYTPVAGDVYPIADCGAATCTAWQTVNAAPLGQFVVGGDVVLGIANPGPLTVNTTADTVALDGACSLREAILAANADTVFGECGDAGGADVIEFAGGGTYGVASLLPTITTDVTIDAAGQAVTVSGQSARPILRINSGSVNLRGLTFWVGRGQGCGATAGGVATDVCGPILNYGDLAVESSTFWDNYSGNSGNGGAIANRAGATLTVRDSLFDDNRAAVNGGAIWNLGTATIVNSTFDRNGDDVTVGSIYTGDPSASTTIINSTLRGAERVVVNSSGTTTLSNSIVNDTGAGIACVGTVTADAFNLDTDGTCGSATTVTTAELDFGPEPGNGGPIKTLSLGPQSAAIGAGDPAVCTSAPVNALDQRGVARTSNGCDVGAFAVPTHVVNDVGDADDATPGDLVCETGLGNGICTLRAALSEANADSGDVDRIHFDIAGAGVHTISPASALPVAGSNVRIDGATEPGATCATWPPTLTVEIDLAGAGTWGISSGTTDTPAVLRGLVINNWSTFEGLAVSGSGARFECNFIGTNVAGNATSGGGASTINVSGSDHVFGGPAATQANVIAGASNRQVFLTANDTLWQGNYFRTDPTGAAIPFTGGSSAQEALFVTGGATGNQIGGIGAGEGNVFRGVNGEAVQVVSGTGNSIRGNSMSDHTFLGIDINPNGVTANDPLDADTGPNNLQNFPVITGAEITGPDLAVDYSIDSGVANSAYPIEIDIYAADSAVSGEGAVYLGSTTIAAPGADTVTIGIGSLTAGDPVVATATDANGNTSEFSAVFTSTANPCDTEWTNAGGDNLWSNAANWSLGVPTASDSVCMDIPAVDTVIVDGTQEVLRFETAEESLSITGTLTVNQASTINGGPFVNGTLIALGEVTAGNGGSMAPGGRIQGDFTVAPATTFFVSGGEFDGTGGGTWTIDGTVAVNGSVLSLTNGGDIVNNGTLRFDTTGSQNLAAGDPGSTITNNGEIRKQGAGDSSIDAAQGLLVDLTPGSSIVVTAGTLTINTPGTWDASGAGVALDVEVGATLAWAGDTSVNGTFTGDFVTTAVGQVAITGTLTSSAPTTLDLADGMVFIDGATLDGAGLFTVSSSVTVDDATLSADVTIASPAGELVVDSGNVTVDGTLTNDENITGAGLTILFLGSGTIDNNGTITTTENGLFDLVGPTLLSDAGSTLDVLDDSSFTVDTSYTELGRTRVEPGAIAGFYGPSTVFDTGSTVELVIDGSSAVTQDNGQIDVDAAAALTLNGTLETTEVGYTPTLGDEYTAITCNVGSCPTFPTTNIGGLAQAAVGTDLVLSVPNPEPANKILSGSGVSGDIFGNAIAIDGNRMAVGAPQDFTGLGSLEDGAVFIFTRADESSPWVFDQRIDNPDVTPTGGVNDEFGAAVALDGDWLVVGAPDENGPTDSSGRAYAINLTTPQTIELNPAQTGDRRFGIAVAIDGDWLVVGADQDDGAASNAGRAYVYEFNGSTWVEDPVVIQGALVDEQLGRGVDIEGDLLAVGTLANASEGRVETYELVGGVWQPTSDPSFSDGGTGAQFGRALEISNGRIIVGGPNDGGGLASVFDRDGTGTWQGLQLTPSLTLGVDDDYGYDVAIDGGLAVVAATKRNGSQGTAVVFSYFGGEWVETDVIVASDGEANDRFGQAVAVQGDNIVVGAALDDNSQGVDSGGVYTFTGVPGAAFSNQLITQDTVAGDLLGQSVDIHEDWMVVGSRLGDSGAVADSGVAHVFTRNADRRWVLFDTLESPTPVAGEWFGNSVAIAGTFVEPDGDLGNAVIAVGAPDPFGAGDGSVYLYRYDYSILSWDLTRTVPAPVGFSEDFGFAVDLDQRTSAFRNGGYSLIVGAPALTGSVVGEAFVYNYTVTENPVFNDSLTLLASLTEGGTDDLFGFSVAIDGDSLIIGERAGDPGGVTDSGTAYVYRVGTTPGSATFEAQLAQPSGEAAAGEGFGHSVDIDGDQAVVTAFFDGTNGAASGAAWVYERTGSAWGVPEPLVTTLGGAGDNFGVAARIEDGVVVVGSFGQGGGDGGGAAEVFRFNGSSWVVGESFDWQGSGAATDGGPAGLALNDDGSLALGYAEVDDLGVDAGGVQVHDITIAPPDNKLLQQVDGPFRTAGIATSADDEWLAVSALSGIFGQGGVIEIFRNVAGDWVFFQELQVNLSRNSRSLAVGGGYLVTEDCGNLTLFEFNGSTWVQADQVGTQPSCVDGELDIDAVNQRLVYSAGNLTGSNIALDVYDLSAGDLQTIETVNLPADVANTFFGRRAAIDGDYLFVTAERDDGALAVANSGSVRVFERSPLGVWSQTQALQNPNGDTATFFGSQGIDAADGRMIVSETGAAGRAFVYENVAGTWGDTAELPGPGWSVAIDGDLAAVGSPNATVDTMTTGSVTVYEFDGGTWQPQSVLSASDREMGDGFANSVEIVGLDLIVAAPFDTNDRGVYAGGVYTFELDAAPVPPPANKIVSDQPETGEDFAISLDHEGDVLVVGAPGNDDQGGSAGTAYAFVRQPNGTWQFDAELPAPGSAGLTGGEDYGNVVAIARDGLSERYLAAIAAPEAGDGEVFIWELAGSWSYLGSLTGDAGELDFGNALDVYDIPGGDNDYVVAVGAPDDGFAAGTGPGAAYVFNVDTTSPTLTLLDKIPGSASSISSTDATGTPHAGFGSDVAFDGDTLLVSAPFNDDAGADAGAVSVFLGNGALTTFTEQAVLYPCGVGACSATGGEFFGVGLDLDGETAAIGATSLGSAIGRVHVFDRDGSTWSATQDFTAATAASDDLFGIDVDIENDVILVGSFAGGASDEGEAFVFRNVAGAWTEEASLTGPDAVGGDQVGGSVSLSADGGILIGSRNVDASGVATAGAAYAFQILVGDLPSLSFQLDVAGPTQVDVAPAGIAIADFDAQIIESTTDAESTLAASPLSEIDLEDTPLAGIAVGETPLAGIVLGSTPLAGIPLLNVDVDGGWDVLLDGTELENVPINDLTFGDALDDPTVLGRVQSLPLAGIDVDGTPLAGIPLAGIALGTTPLAGIPLAGIGQSWCTILDTELPEDAPWCSVTGTEADLNITLMEATLRGVPLAGIPLAGIPLAGIDFAATPLAGIPLAGIGLESTPLAGIPLAGIPLAGIDLSTTPLAGIPLAGIDPAQLPLAGIPLAGIDVNGSPLAGIPLAGIPVEDIATSIPLAGIPLAGIDVEGAPLAGIPLAGILLMDAPLAGIPLAGIGGSTTADQWCGLLTEIGGGFNCENGVDPSTTTLFQIATQGVPLAGIPLEGTPLAGIPLAGIPLAGIDIAGLPLAGIPLAGIPLAGIQLDTTPLAGIPLAGIPLAGIDIQGSPLAGIPLAGIDVGASPLAGIPLAGIPLAGIPLAGIPLAGIDLGSTPLAGILLAGIDIIGSPLAGIPLAGIEIAGVPLAGIGVDCATGVVNCELDSLGDAIAAGAIDLNTPLSVLLPALAGLSLDDVAAHLSNFTAQDVIDALIAEGLTLQDLSRYDGLTLGDLPATDAAFATTPLGAIEDALLNVSFEDLARALIDPATGLSLDDAAIDAALQDALSTLGLTIGDLDVAGDVTLGELLGGSGTSANITLQTLGTFLGLIPLQSILDPAVGGTLTGALGNLDDLTADELEGLTLGDLVGVNEFGVIDIVALLTLLDQAGLLADFSLGDLLLGLVDAGQLPFGGFDFTEVETGQLPAGTVPDIPYSATFTVSDTLNTQVVEVAIALPTTATYVPGTSTVADGISSPVDLEPVIDANQLVWSIEGVQPGASYTISFDVRPEVSLGATSLSGTARVVGSPVSIGDLATVTVEEGAEDNDFPLTSLADPNRIYLTYISDGVDIDVFEIEVLDNDVLAIELSGLPADFDLALYYEAPAGSSVGSPLSGTSDNDPVVPISDPDQSGADSEPLNDFVRLDQIDPSLQLLEVSNTAGLDNEVIVTERLPAGVYYIQVFGANGASSPDPAVLQVQLDAAENRPACVAAGPSGPEAPGVAPILAGSTANTLILVNEMRLERFHGAQARADVVAELGELTTYLNANPSLGIDPLVVPVDGFANVVAAYEAWDNPADPEDACDPEVANAVVSTINSTIIDPLRDQLEYVVILGGDEQIPFARLEDNTTIANEYDYRHEFDGDLEGPNASGANAFTATFWERRFLSDEPYGESAAQSLGNRFLYVSDLSLGRVVESPDDIIRSLDDFVTNQGSLDTASASVLGYDFLVDGSNEIAANIADSALPLSDFLADGSDDPDTIPDNGGTAWDRLAAEAELIAAGQNSLISLNAHFDHYRALPAAGDQVPGFNDNLIAAGVTGLAGASGFAQTLIFSMGCHSGLAVPDSQIALTNEDWAQELTGTGALYVGNTGFGYGDTEAVAYTEQLMANFAYNVSHPVDVNGFPTTVGQALTFAKNEYVAELAVLSVYDEKAVMESTFYGLPFYRTALPTQPLPAPPTNSPAPDASGVSALLVDNDPVNSQVVTDSGTYYANFDDDGNELTIVAPGRPIQPSDSVDVSVVDPAAPTELDEVAHGAIVLDMTSTWVLEPDPVVATPIFDESVEQPEPEVGDVTFPAKPVSINTSVTPGGERQTLVLATGQYRSENQSQRLDDDIEVVVYYAPPSETDFTEPEIGVVESTLVDGFLTVTLTVDDADNVVDKVYLLIAEDPNVSTADWVGLDLGNSGGSEWSGSIQLDPLVQDIEFLVQARDSAGNVAYATNKANNFSDDSAPPPPPPPTPDLVVTVDPTNLDAASGWYTGSVDIIVDSGLLASTFVTGTNDPVAVTGGTFTITDEGLTNWSVTTEDGQTTNGFVRIDSSGDPVITLGTPVNGGSYPTATGTVDFLCTDTSLVDCELTIGGVVVEPGDPLPTAPGGYNFSVTATDILGGSTTLTGMFDIEAVIDQIPTIELIDAPTTPQLITDGATVVVEFDDLDGVSDDYTVSFDWGDYDENETPGSSTVCTASSSSTVGSAGASTCELVAEPDAGSSTIGTFASSILYAEPGVYTLTATVTDSVGNSVSQVFEFLVVYDPAGGRVSGAGWFWSDNSSYPLDNDPWGNWAFFGYRARYRNGEDTPRGRTKLHLLGEFFFRSTSYDYLIINDTTAVAEGDGRVGGQSGYRFRIQGIDNGWLDYVQITIWNEATGETVYDNGAMFDEGDLVLFGGIRIRS